jgi:hypothetical protein
MLGMEPAMPLNSVKNQISKTLETVGQRMVDLAQSYAVRLIASEGSIIVPHARFTNPDRSTANRLTWKLKP